MKGTVNKVYRNALLLEKMVKLDKYDRRKIVLNLLQHKTERELESELGIPRSTLHDWKSLRQDNTGENIHVSLAMIKRKLSSFKPTNSEDIVYLIDIKKIIESILEKKE